MKTLCNNGCVPARPDNQSNELLLTQFKTFFNLHVCNVWERFTALEFNNNNPI